MIGPTTTGGSRITTPTPLVPCPNSRPRGIVLASLAISALTVLLLGTATRAEAAPTSAQVRFSVSGLVPGYAPSIEDYVVRCRNGPVTVAAHAAGGWQISIASHPFRSGTFNQTVGLSAGRAFVVRAREGSTPPLYRYHVRCLPDSFPAYTFTRYGPVSPKFFTVSRTDLGYGIIFDNRGVPIWWVRAPGFNLSVLASGNLLWFNGPSFRYELHRLDGSLIRTLRPVGLGPDGHDLQFLPNGDHLIAGRPQQNHVDASPYGKSSDASVYNAELQQVTPNGQLAWNWQTQDHISLAETGRWWNERPTENQPYDIVHWNSIEQVGNDAVIASFRNLDAVYKISKSTDEILWKLGGTSRAESLTTIGDPRTYTFGAQHDARLLSDGTVTVFDNRSRLPDKAPRAVRFRINEQAKTATLLESISDPAVPSSECCGSARRMPNGDWLIDWGQARGHPVGGYKPNGQRTFFLSFATRTSYRAQPVPSGVYTADDLRAAMNARCSSGCN